MADTKSHQPQPEPNDERLRVVFNSPQSGYMSLGLNAGAREFSTVVACRPYDSLSDLIEALTALAGGDAGPRVVRWNCEPDEIDFRFSTGESGRVSFAVCHYATNARAEEASRTVFAAEGTRREIAAAFLEALAGLERDKDVDVFESNWRREFPAHKLRELDAAVGALADGA
jgi:hypothetical protein